MSRSADIDFTFEAPVVVSNVLRLMAANGMSFSNEGVVTYLLDEDGMFNWLEAGGESLDDLISEIGRARWGHATVGISLFLPDSIRGGDLLFHPGRSTVSFVISINRKNLPGSSKFCDIGWYLDRMIPVLEAAGLSEVETRDSA